jgi:hypothetical protein
MTSKTNKSDADNVKNLQCINISNQYIMSIDNKDQKQL